MKELFPARDSLANQISYYHLAAFLLSLPFYRFYSHLILISFAIHTLIHYNRLAVKPLLRWRTLILQSVFFVTVLSTIYASNKALAFNDWGLDITIFLVPILFCLNPLNLKKYKPQLMLWFALGCTATIVYLYIDAILTLRFYKLPLILLFSPAFTNHNFAQPIDMHATFFSLQITLALVYILSLLTKEKTRANKIFYSILGLILLAGIIQLSSKSIFVALFLVINIGFPYLVLHGLSRKRFILISASLTLVIIAAILGSPALRDRYLTGLRDDFSRANSGETTGSRIERWGIAANLVAKSPVIGYGAGSEIPLLGEKFYSRKFYTAYLHRLNAHNEYLSFLVKSGIWGLAVYLITLAYGFRIAFRKKDILFLAFMILVAVVSLSENILDVDKGVIYYSFFFPFFVFISEQKERLPIPIKRHKNLRTVATNRMAVTSSI